LDDERRSLARAGRVLHRGTCKGIARPVTPGARGESCGPLQASLRFYEIGLGGLAEYFEALARDWRGWSGERLWTSLEDDVELVAAHDGHGTIALKARFRTEAFAQHRWTASAELLLDAGGLDRVAREARMLL
jgi:hypothetical protein